MAEFLKNFFGGGSGAAAPSAAPSDDGGFARFAAPVAPSHAAAPASSASSVLSVAASQTLQPNFLTAFSNPQIAGIPISQRPFTKWYYVWERVTFSDFAQELLILPFIVILIFVHVWGSRSNKQKARQWARSHVPLLQQEFAMVGTDKKTAADEDDPMKLLKPKSSSQYVSYATGRENIAWIDINLNLSKRYNPMAQFGEQFLGFVFESLPAPKERMEAAIFLFDGKENEMIPSLYVKQNQAQSKGESYKAEKFKSTYDNFVFAIVHKDSMKILRDQRYDLSLTTTKDHAKLPSWATLMSESAEVSDMLLTSELLSAIQAAGSEHFEALIVTDQPNERPTTLDETVSQKRIILSMKLPKDNDYSSSAALFKLFLRLPDFLINSGRFRPEALKRVRLTREDEAKKIRKADESEKSEERRLKLEKEKKEERDRKLSTLGPEEQRKYLERERALDIRRSQKSRTMKAR